MSDQDGPSSQVNAGAIGVAEAAGLFTRLGLKVSEEMIRRDLDAGAPSNPDGSLDLVAYGAWLVREMARRD